MGSGLGPVRLHARQRPPWQTRHVGHALADSASAADIALDERPTSLEGTTEPGRKIPVWMRIALISAILLMLWGAIFVLALA